MEVRKSGDPFEVDPLPKTFYYPSKEKQLPEDERKLCLSPDHRKKDHVKSPADEKFLQQTNHIRIHEIPTRENGTTEPDQSSSSKFDESWPSTERALVSTPEAGTEDTERSKTPSSDRSDFPLRPLPNSTLARYIDRFRNAAPSSRHERDHTYFDSGKGGEFWWLSPSPSSSSTPKEGTPPDRQLPSPYPSLSPKLKRSTFRRGTAPASPISKARSTSSPSKSSLDGLDMTTVELQQRAKALLEKSESTLETSTSEIHRPVRRVKQGPLEDRTLREAPSKHLSTTPPGQVMERHSIQRQPRPAPPPEEDILYQWRLARKMERAQERAVKWGPAKGTNPLGTLRPIFAHAGAELESHGLSSAVRIPQPTSTPCPSPESDFAHQRPGFQVSAPSATPGVPGGTENLSSRTQTTFSTLMAVVSDREGISSQMVPSFIGISSQPQATVSSGQLSQLGAEMSSGTHEFVPSTEPSPAMPEISGQVHTLVVEQDQFEPADVPSHMHLSCDILPCPHQRALIEKGRSDKTTKLPLSSPVVESMQEELHIAERDIVIERDQKPQRTVIRESRGRIERLPGKRNGTEDKDARSKAGSKDSEREKNRGKEVGKQKPKSKKESSQEPAATDVLSGVIGEVVSERLFSTPQSSNSSLSGSDEGLRQRLPQEQDHRAHASEGDNSSDNEFPDDEVLKMLRQKARSYREQLKQIDSILNQQAAGRPGL